LSMGPTVVIVARRKVHAIVSCVLVLWGFRPLVLVLFVVDVCHFVKLIVVWLGAVGIVYVGVICEFIVLLSFFCDDP
jgi:hypothetical protein